MYVCALQGIKNYPSVRELFFDDYYMNIYNPSWYEVHALLCKEAYSGFSFII